MTDMLSPGLILIAGAALLPLLRGVWQRGFMLLLPLLGFWQTLTLDPGAQGAVEMFGVMLTTLRVDPLSLIFAYIFHIAALLSAIYALHVRDTVQHVAGMAYAGAAIGAVFAGDLITLFVYWELTAVTSVFLIWARREEKSYWTGLRYLIVQVGSGVVLLAGIVIHQHQSGSIAFTKLTLGELGPTLIFLAFGVKCAFPILHSWLQDSYPEATVTGTVFLSAFTTKLAVYALARSFAGTEMLIWIGATMAAFPIFYAVIENDLRRVLAYSLISQLGYMVIGIGIGTELALNGTAAHAFCHILYKALLFMSMGAVLLRTGTVKGSELGGLYKSMPWTAGFCVIGAAAISAFPLFSGFISKSMIITASADGGYWLAWGVLMFASAGALLYLGIKVPYFAFFAQDSGIRVKEAPVNMLLAMAAAALLCVGIGVFPGSLYAILPFPVHYAPYTATHVITQLQLLLFSALAFAVLIRFGIYPVQMKSVTLDSDWVYRRLAPRAVRAVWRRVSALQGRYAKVAARGLNHLLVVVFHYHGPDGVMARTWPIGGAALWVLILLGGFLIVYFV